MSAPQEITIEMMREKLYAAVVSDALDALGYKNQSPRVPLPPQTSEGVLVGRCKTTQWEDIDFEDPSPYELELKAIDACQANDVLICAANGSMHSGVWGELLSTASKNRGCIGAIIHGAVRDISNDEPVQIDSVTFCSGDLVIADEDGVVVVPQEIEETAIQNAWKKVHDENVTRDAIINGMLATEAYKKYGVL